MEQLQNEGLKRELGIFDVAINVVNISISSGIFILPALIAAILGSASIVAYILCGLMLLLIALCYAEVGSRITTSGGAYIYIQKSFGSYFGFLANGILWFGVGVLVVAAILNGIADMLSIPFPIFGIWMYRVLFFFIVLGLIAVINIRGVKEGVATVKWLTLIKIIPLLAVVLAGLFNVKTANLQWQYFPTLDKLGEASLILFFGFAGGETVLNISGEMKNPNRTGPLGLVIGVVSVVVFYCLIQIVAQGVLGNALVNNKKAPIAAVANQLFGSWSVTLLVSCAIVAMIGCLNSIALVFPRVLFAGSKDGLLPTFLSTLHKKYETPAWAIIAFTTIAFIMAISGGYKQLIVLVTISSLLLNLGVVIVAIKCRLQPTPANAAAFTLPGGLTIPVAALVIICWFLFHSKANEVIGTGIFIAVLSLIYFFRNLKSFQK
jgi:APA family basic amino acid/polyamine antiporter